MEDQPTRGASNATGYELSRQVLLRSVAVVPQTPALYLLTTTAERYFPKFRFEPIGRTDVATTVQTSLEFSSACPSSATVMRKSLR